MNRAAVAVMLASSILVAAGERAWATRIPGDGGAQRRGRAAATAVGRVSGTIADPSGAPLGGITLVITGPALPAPRRVVTDAEGRFEVADLPAGRIAVTCTAPGFVQWRREGLEVRPDRPVTLEVTMRRLSTPPATASPAPPPIVGPALPRPSPPAPDPAPTPQPAPAPPASHGLLDAIDSYLQQLDSGAIAFNAPERMRTRETVDVRLLLSPMLSVESLQQELADEVGNIQGGVVRIAPQMEAVLTGQGFAVSAITPATQAVSRAETTQWVWQVTAETAGEHRLHLVLNATIEGTSRTLRTFDRTIVVNVTLGQRVSAFTRNNWQWLWTTALVPLAGWAWRRRQARRPASRDAAAP